MYESQLTGEMMSEEFDCTACGACCMKTEEDVYVALTQADLKRLPTKYRRKARPTEDPDDEPFELPFKRLNGYEVCVALKGKLGKDCRCVVYSQRPDNCREAQCGSAQCLQARHILFSYKEKRRCSGRSSQEKKSRSREKSIVGS